MLRNPIWDGMSLEGLCCVLGYTQASSVISLRSSEIFMCQVHCNAIERTTFLHFSAGWTHLLLFGKSPFLQLKDPEKDHK